ncbi:MAG: hypothetical protein M1434_09705 [Chloroflexi bacterium]|nr:hypothetical protein [Chloroflexota bacterium]MCL5274999.1 hypothetical protein [Chloroflexota bacterium]
MTVLTIQLSDEDYQRLEKTAREAGKTVQDVIQDWIAELPETSRQIDLSRDPIYLFEGYDAAAPVDLAENPDAHLYQQHTLR